MRLGAMLGEGQKALWKAAERNERLQEKERREKREAKKNRRRQSGQTVRYEPDR